MSFKISWKVHILTLIISFAVCFMMSGFINNLFFILFENNLILSITKNQLLDLSIFLIISFIPITVIHEFFHGMAYKFFGGKVRYGFKGIYAYTEEISGVILKRIQFLIVLLAPLTLISIMSIFIPGIIGSFIFLLNFLGSIGDILMALYLFKGNKNSYIKDRSYGFDIVDNQCK